MARIKCSLHHPFDHSAFPATNLGRGFRSLYIKFWLKRWKGSFRSQLPSSSFPTPHDHCYRVGSRQPLAGEGEEVELGILSFLGDLDAGRNDGVCEGKSGSATA